MRHEAELDIGFCIKERDQERSESQRHDRRYMSFLPTLSTRRVGKANDHDLEHNCVEA